MPPDSYSDRLCHLINRLHGRARTPEDRALRADAISLLREQAAMIVRLENELEVAYAYEESRD